MPAHDPPNHHQPDTTSHVERLRRVGVRVTPQRLLVLAALAAHGGHMTAEAILRWAAERYPTINLATIYRTLDVLASIGLVARTDLGAGSSYFELVGESPHHHLVCERCGVMIEMDDALLLPLRNRLLEAYGFLADPRHVAIFGLCRECMASAEAAGASVEG